jgi:hypothetical protein
MCLKVWFVSFSYRQLGQSADKSLGFVLPHTFYPRNVFHSLPQSIFFSKSISDSTLMLRFSFKIEIYKYHVLEREHLLTFDKSGDVCAGWMKHWPYIICVTSDCRISNSQTILIFLETCNHQHTHSYHWKEYNSCLVIMRK